MTASRPKRAPELVRARMAQRMLVNSWLDAANSHNPRHAQRVQGIAVESLRRLGYQVEQCSGPTANTCPILNGGTCDPCIVSWPAGTCCWRTSTSSVSLRVAPAGGGGDILGPAVHAGAGSAAGEQAALRVLYDVFPDRHSRLFSQEAYYQVLQYRTH